MCLYDLLRLTTSQGESASSTAKDSQPAPTSTPSADKPSEQVAPLPLELDLEISEDNPLYEQFKDVLSKFQESGPEDLALKEPDKPEIYFDDDHDIQDEDEEQQTVQKMSKKKRKEQNKLSIAELKALVSKPDLVEWNDPSATEPKLHVGIKSARNVVPVPSHWSLKREYLSSKRGIEKPPFALPKFIQETGIAEMRDAVLEKQAETSLKQRQRERVQPKMGKLDIDYQKLYEAFFRFQTKPELTRYGEVYYEGKEYETNLRHLRPGELSEELKEALNIPPGAPPPWLINQQRFGPPPSYPALKIPGLNAPPPPGGQWGFHPGGYGKPPVDEFNRPLYGGDIFGVLQTQQNHQSGEPVEKTLWGELQEPEESEEEEEDEDEDDDDDDDDGYEDNDVKAIAAGIRTNTTAGTASVVPVDGDETGPENDFALRKAKKGGTETEEPAYPRTAGTVIQEREARAQGFFGSDRAYDLRAAQAGLPVLGQDDNSRKRKIGDVDVAVDVDALEGSDRLSQEEMKRRYEAGRKEQQPQQWVGGNVDDQDAISKMIAEESNKRLKQDQERRSRR